MSMELVNSVAGIGTFLVIGATAIAAVVQLRHLRASNQLQGLLTVLARVEDAKFNQWTDGARREVTQRMPDPAYRRAVLDNTLKREDCSWLNLANSYEWVGSLVRQGLIDEDAFMDIYSSRVVAAWELVADVVALIRRRDPATWTNFEYLYVQGQAWIRRYPQGIYPKNAPHAHLEDRWLAADSAGVS